MLKERYTLLMRHRECALRTAREVAALTLPAIAPPEGWNEETPLLQPYQSFTSRCVTSLATRIALALLPPGFSGFRMTLSTQIVQEMGGKVTDQVEEYLQLCEVLAATAMLQKQWRTVTNMAMQYLIIAGNVGEMHDDSDHLFLYPIEQYVVVRGLNGLPIEWMTHDTIYEEQLSERLHAIYNSSQSASRTPAQGAPSGRSKGIDLFTRGEFLSNRWVVTQELNGVPTSDPRTYDRSPFRAYRWSPIARRDWARGKGEEHFGDLKAYDALSAAELDQAAMAARNFVRISPTAVGGVNLRRRIEKARNGDTVLANEGEVGLVSFTNPLSYQLIAGSLANRKQELGASFLLTSSTVRDAERVTREEIIRNAQDIEHTLGGVYSHLSTEMQQDRIETLIDNMMRRNEFPKVPNGTIRPTVTAGLEALDRQQDLTRVLQFTQVVQGLPPQVSMAYPKWEVLLRRAAAAIGVADAINGPDEARQILQQMAQAQAQSAEAAPNGPE